MKASDIDRIGNNLYAALNRKIASKEHQIAEKVSEAVEKVQKTFFRIMASQIIGVDTAPSLGEYTPTWAALSPDYVRRKARMHVKGFYTFTGKLEKNLVSKDAVTTFGLPYAVVTRGSRAAGVYDTGEGVRSRTGHFAGLSSNPSSVIRVHVFPKIAENVMDAQPVEFEGQYLWAYKIGAKLTNYRGGRDRPILVPFMRWWLNVKMKQAIQKAIR